MNSKRKFKSLKLTIILLFVFSFSQGQGIITGETNTDGSIKKWHKIELILEGPDLNESPATFRNFRLDVTFTSPTNRVFTVPGFFDGDDDPANTSAASGNIWKARFTAGEEGEWRYAVSFVTGTDVAANLTGGTRGTAPDGQTGIFTIGSQDKSGKDFRAKGKLEYVGEHYLQFANGENFIKIGANSPEVFIADEEIDGGVGNVNHSAQISDFNPGDPTWGNDQGRGIIGVVNYLSDRGVNSHYFLSMNILGDGRRSFPFVNDESPYTYDVSKLAQWEIVFSQFDKMGLMVHFQTQETENMQFFEDLEGGVNQTEFSVARRIYYRELVARFGHHLAITWNIGEENNANFGSSQAQNTPRQRRLFADRISDLTPYEDNITIHNGGAGHGPALRLFNDLLGNNSYTGTSLQYIFDDVDHENIKFWYDQSEAAGKKWVISYDEAFDGNNTRELTQLRKGVIWSTLMAGGQFEWYHGGGDLNTNRDYADFEDQWTTMGIAANFMNTNLSREIHRMTPNDGLINNDNYAMAELGNVYLFYLIDGGNATVDLSAGTNSSFTVQWFNPRTGDLINGPSVNGGSANTNLGNPPSQTGDDWAILLKSSNPNNNQAPIVSFTMPSSGEELIAPASVSVDVSASDSDGSVVSVELFLNDVFVRRESRSPYLWNDRDQDAALSDLPNGLYTLRAVATDNEGAASTAVRTFVVGTANLPPVVSFSSPANDENFISPASVNVDVSASDSDGSIVSVDLFLNDVFVRQERVTPYLWNDRNQDASLSNLPIGSYTLTAIATDNDGATTSIERTFTVGSEINPDAPQIEFTLPLDNDTTAQNIIVNVASTNPDIDIANVILFLDGELIRQENVFPYVWNSRNGGSLDSELNNLSIGSHELRAVATSAEGITGETIISINVISDDLKGVDEVVEISTYPNPFTNTLTVEGFNASSEIYAANIVSMNGSILSVPVTIDENGVQFSTDNLANGMYLVRLNTATGIFTEAVVKQ